VRVNGPVGIPNPPWGGLKMSFLLDDILLGPCKAVTWIGKTLLEHAESEMTDESAIQQRLLDLQMQFERDEISEDQYVKQEDALMQRLDEIRKYKESGQKR
jgi:hypothetical protein